MMTTSAVPGRQPDWDKRIRRATELGERFSYAGEILAFYRKILEFERAIYLEIPTLAQTGKPGVAFRERLDIEVAARRLPALLALVERSGPAKLAQQAKEISGYSAAQQREMIAGFLRSEGDGEAVANSFFARVLLQPHAEYLATFEPAQPEGAAGSVCPVCGARPQAAVLHPEGDGGKRFLLCSLCLTEWEFRRVLCPICDEKDYQKLPRYSAEDPAAVRVEACDTCHFYLKSIDMTVDGHAVPLVDEVATVPLDLWAEEHGYKKAERNLMGF
jgi:FdhE protein